MNTLNNIAAAAADIENTLSEAKIAGFDACCEDFPSMETCPEALGAPAPKKSIHPDVKPRGYTVRFAGVQYTLHLPHQWGGYPTFIQNLGEDREEAIAKAIAYVGSEAGIESIISEEDVAKFRKPKKEAGTLSFGKYRGQTLDYVTEKDPKYLNYIIKTVLEDRFSNPKWLKDAVAILKKERKEAREAAATGTFTGEIDKRDNFTLTYVSTEEKPGTGQYDETYIIHTLASEDGSLVSFTGGTLKSKFNLVVGDTIRVKATPKRQWITKDGERATRMNRPAVAK